jgi:hypothetical protein
MGLKIVDEFAELPISRQRKYQLRMLRDSRCSECGEPAVLGSRCLKHMVRARERQRKKRGLKRRYHNTLSYRLQQEIATAGGRTKVKSAAGPKNGTAAKAVSKSGKR